MTREIIKQAERLRNDTFDNWVKDIFPTWTPKVKALIAHNAQQSAMIAELELKQIFKPIDDEAKKAGQVLLDVGLPWPVVGIYNTASEEWVYAEVQAELIDDEYYYYYQTEHEKEPRGWMPMPTI
jgi:hypothetical protein